MTNRLAKLAGPFIESSTAAVLIAAIGIAGMTIESPTAKTTNPVVIMETTKGTIKIELYPDEAPITVKNFLWYVDHKFYEGLIFHRVIGNFMIQGGGFTRDLVKKQPNAPIKNEADNGLKNERGTIAMARTSKINSATSQFFINLKDNHGLNFRERTLQGYGYAVFGRVIDGMDVVDAIAKVKTIRKDGYNDVPATPVVIKKAYRLEKEGAKGKAPGKKGM